MAGRIEKNAVAGEAAVYAADPVLAEEAVGVEAVGVYDAPVTPAPAKKTVLWYVELLASVIVIAAMVGELGVTILNVVDRALRRPSYGGALDVAYLALETIAFLGAAVAYRRGTTPSVHVLTERLSEWKRGVAETTADWLSLVFAILLGIWTVPVAKTYSQGVVTSLGISEVVEIIPLAAGAVLTGIFALGKIGAVHPRQRIAGAASAIVVVLAGVGCAELRVTLNSPALGAVVIWLIFFSLMMIGVPIAYAVGLASFAFVYVPLTGFGDLPAIPQQIQTMTGSSFLLLAIPFFVWAGLLLAHGGPSKRIAELMFALVGRFRGGAMQAVVYSMFVFSGLSGSKIADMAMMGTTLQETAKKQGYSKADTGAMIAASACMGETIPPSIVILLLASVTTLGVETLFAAGIIPAAVLAVALSCGIYVDARRRRVVTGKLNARDSMMAILRGIVPTALVVLLVWAIVSGTATPTEASAFAVVYALLLVVVVYRATSAGQLWRISADACAMAGTLLFLAASAAGFAWAMAVSGASQAIIDGITSVGHNKAVFWLVSMGAMILLGLVLEGAPSFLIFGPLLVPVAGDVGINQVQFGICMLIAFGLGFFAPPFGAGLIMAGTITEVPTMELARKIVPYWLLIVAGLAVCAAFPPITLWLPRLLNLPGA